MKPTIEKAIKSTKNRITSKNHPVILTKRPVVLQKIHEIPEKHEDVSPQKMKWFSDLFPSSSYALPHLNIIYILRQLQIK